MRRQLLPVALLFISVTVPAFAKGDHSNNDRASVGQDITVAEGESVGDISCVFCSVHVKGDVSGDIATVLGSVIVEPGHRVYGDVAVVGGDIAMGEESAIGGDLCVVAGSTQLSDNATVHGSRFVLPGRAWLLVSFAPLLILIGIIWLIVWLVRRNRYRYPVYPGAPGPQPPVRR